jgi:hypothetical protein
MVTAVGAILFPPGVLVPGLKTFFSTGRYISEDSSEVVMLNVSTQVAPPRL